MATVSPPRPAVNLEVCQGKIRHPLQRLRVYIRSYIAAECTALVLLFLAVWFWLGMVCDYGLFALHRALFTNRYSADSTPPDVPPFDWMEHVPSIFLALLILFIGICLAIVTYHILRRMLREFRDRALALLLERRFPGLLGDRLITAVELADVKAATKYGYSRAMIEKTIVDAADRVDQIPIRQVFNWRRLVVLFVLVLFTTLGMTGLVIAGFVAGTVGKDGSGYSVSFERGWQSFSRIFSTTVSRNFGLKKAYWDRDSYLEVVGYPRYRLTSKVRAKLVDKGVPQEVADSLKSLDNQEKTTDEFLDAVAELLKEEEYAKYSATILENAEKVAMRIGPPPGQQLGTAKLRLRACKWMIATKDPLRGRYGWRPMKWSDVTPELLGTTDLIPKLPPSWAADSNQRTVDRVELNLGLGDPAFDTIAQHIGQVLKKVRDEDKAIADPNITRLFDDSPEGAQADKQTRLVIRDDPTRPARPLMWSDLMDRQESIELTEQSFDTLRKADVPGEVLTKLKPLEGKKLFSRRHFTEAVAKLLGAEDQESHGDKVVDSAETGPGLLEIKVPALPRGSQRDLRVDEIPDYLAFKKVVFERLASLTEQTGPGRKVRALTIPNKITVYYHETKDTGKRNDASFDVSASNEYAVELSGLKENITYRIRGKDYFTPYQDIEVIKVPSLESFSYERYVPAYTIYRLTLDPEEMVENGQPLSPEQLSLRLSEKQKKLTGLHQFIEERPLSVTAREEIKIEDVPAGSLLIFKGKLAEREKSVRALKVAPVIEAVAGPAGQLSATVRAALDVDDPGSFTVTVSNLKAPKFTGEGKRPAGEFAFDLKLIDRDDVENLYKVKLIVKGDDRPTVNVDVVDFIREIKKEDDPKKYHGLEGAKIVTIDGCVLFKGDVKDDHGLTRTDFVYTVTELNERTDARAIMTARAVFELGGGPVNIVQLAGVTPYFHMALTSKGSKEEVAIDSRERRLALMAFEKSGWYKLNPARLNLLKKEGAPKELLDKLETLEESFPESTRHGGAATEAEFIRQLRTVLDNDELQRWQEPIVKYARRPLRRGIPVTEAELQNLLPRRFEEVATEKQILNQRQAAGDFLRSADTFLLEQDAAKSTFPWNGLDLKYLKNSKGEPLLVREDKHKIAINYKIQIDRIEAQDNCTDDVESGPTPHRSPSKEPYTIVVVAEEELLNLISRDEAAIQLEMEKGIIEANTAELLMNTEIKILSEKPKEEDFRKIGDRIFRDRVIKDGAHSINTIEDNIERCKEIVTTIHRDMDRILNELYANRVSPVKVQEVYEVVTGLKGLIDKDFEEIRKGMAQLRTALDDTEEKDIVQRARRAQKAAENVRDKIHELLTKLGDVKQRMKDIIKNADLLKILSDIQERQLRVLRILQDLYDELVKSQLGVVDK